MFFTCVVTSSNKDEFHTERADEDLHTGPTPLTGIDRGHRDTCTTPLHAFRLGAASSTDGVRCVLR